MLKILRYFFGLLLLLVALGLVAMLFLGPPAELIDETIELARLNRLATATIASVGTVSGDDATSRAVVNYQFEAGGRTIRSDRRLVGWAPNQTTWTNGGTDAGRYAKGDHVPVYYSAADPGCCALERGWFKWPVSMTALVWGCLALAFIRSRQWLRLMIHGIFVYAALLIFFGPTCVRVDQLQYQILAWLGCTGGIFLWGFFRGLPHRLKV